jgi:DNA polymerase-3 subunit alpha
MNILSHLHVHTTILLLDGAASIQKLYKKAIDDNMPALANLIMETCLAFLKFVAEAYKHKNEDGSIKG